MRERQSLALRGWSRASHPGATRHPSPANGRGEWHPNSNHCYATLPTGSLPRIAGEGMIWDPAGSLGMRDVASWAPCSGTNAPSPCSASAEAASIWRVRMPDTPSRTMPEAGVLLAQCLGGSPYECSHSLILPTPAHYTHKAVCIAPSCHELSTPTGSCVHSETVSKRAVARRLPIRRPHDSTAPPTRHIRCQLQACQHTSSGCEEGYGGRLSSWHEGAVHTVGKGRSCRRAAAGRCASACPMLSRCQDG